MRAREFGERGLQAGEVLGSELGKCGEGVGNSEEGVAITVEFEVFGALGDQLGDMLERFCGCARAEDGERRTAAGSSSRSILNEDYGSRVFWKQIKGALEVYLRLREYRVLSVWWDGVAMQPWC